MIGKESLDEAMKALHDDQVDDANFERESTYTVIMGTSVISVWHKKTFSSNKLHKNQTLRLPLHLM